MKINMTVFWGIICALLWIMAGCTWMATEFHIQDRPVHRTHVQMIG